MSYPEGRGFQSSVCSPTTILYVKYKRRLFGRTLTRPLSLNLETSAMYAHVRTHPLYFFGADLNISSNNKHVIWKNVRL